MSMEAFSNYMARMMPVDFSDLLNKKKEGRLTLEDMLRSNELINDLKNNTESQFADMFTPEVLKKLMDYCTLMPVEDSLEIGYKFPFNACEILCCENGFNFAKIIEKLEAEERERKELKKIEEDKRRAEEARIKEEMIRIEEEKRRTEEERIKEELNRIEEEKRRLEREKDEEERQKRMEEELKRLEEEKRKKEEEQIGEGDEEIKDKVKEEKEEDNQKDCLEDHQAEIKEEEKPENTAHEQLQLHQEEDPKEIKPEPQLNLNQEVKERIELQSDTMQSETEEQITEQKTIQSHHRKKLPLLEDDIVKQIVIPEELNTEDKPLQAEQESPMKEPLDTSDEPKISCEERATIIAYDLLDHLFSFVKTPPKDDNYVLVGYFAKILGYVLFFHPKVIIEYLFIKNPEARLNLIHHLNRKSIGNLFENIIVNLKDTSISNSTAYKVSFTKEIMNELLSTKDAFTVEVICELISTTYLYPKDIFVLLLTTPDVFETLSKCIEKFINKSNPSLVTNLIRLLIKVNEMIVKDFDKRVTLVNAQPESEMNKIINSLDSKEVPPSNGEANEVNLIQSHFDRILSITSSTCTVILTNLINEKEEADFDSTYRLPQKVLGMKKLVLWEYFLGVFELILNGACINSLKQQVAPFIFQFINLGIFNHAIETYFAFGLNNMYQNIFDSFIQMAIIEATPNTIIHHMFSVEQCNFLTRLKENMTTATKLNYNSVNMINSPLLAINIMLFNKIMDTKNAKLIDIIVTELGDIRVFNEKVVRKVRSIFVSKLLQPEASTSTTVTKNYEKRDLNSDIIEYDSDSDKKEEVKLSVKSLRDVFNGGMMEFDCHVKGIEYKDAFDEVNPLQEEEDLKESTVKKMVDDENKPFARVEAHAHEGMEVVGLEEFNPSANEEILFGSGHQSHEEKEDELVSEDYNNVNYWTISFIPGKLEEMIKNLHLDA